MTIHTTFDGRIEERDYARYKRGGATSTSHGATPRAVAVSHQVGKRSWIEVRTGLGDGFLRYARDFTVRHVHFDSLASSIVSVVDRDMPPFRRRDIP